MLCDYCGNEIKTGEDYYSFGDEFHGEAEHICEDCIDEYVRDHRMEYIEEQER